MKTVIRSFLVAAALLVATAATVQLAAQGTPAPQNQADHTHPATPADGSGNAGDSAMHGAMMHQMMRDMETQDAKIQALVTRMNAASGAEKTEAMAALLTALVAERPMMHQHMRHMMEMMAGPRGHSTP
jgi:hypothetical protein